MSAFPTLVASTLTLPFYDRSKVYLQYKLKSIAGYHGSWVLAFAVDRGHVTGSDLCTVARANAKFHEKASRMLWGHLHLDNHCPDSNRRSMNLLLSLAWRRTQTHLIRKLATSRLICHLDIDWAENEPIKTLNLLFRSAMKLQTLKIRFSSGSASPDEMQKFSSSFLTKNPMDHLEQLHLSNISIRPADTVEFMLLPKMRKLSLTHVDDGAFVDDKDSFVRDSISSFMSRRRLPHKSPVTNLILGPWVQPERADAHMIWDLLEEVKSINYNLGEYVPEINPSRFQAKMGKTPLHWIISNWSTTLTELRLSGYCAESLSAQFAIDFSLFKSLTVLDITNTLLFCAKIGGDAASGFYPIEVGSRNGLIHRLPKSLEKLRIFFDAGSSFLDPEYNPSNHPFTRESLEWLEELTVHPKLKNVEIEEHYCCSSITIPQNINGTDPDGNVPYRLSRLFISRGMELHVRSRKLHGFVLPSELNVVIPDERYYNEYSPWQRDNTYISGTHDVDWKTERPMGLLLEILTLDPLP